MTFLFYQFELVCHNPQIRCPRTFSWKPWSISEAEGFAGSVKFTAVHFSHRHTRTGWYLWIRTTLRKYPPAYNHRLKYPATART